MIKYRYRCRHCGKEFERDQLIKRSFCEKTQRKTNLIRLYAYPDVSGIQLEDGYTLGYDMSDYIE